MKLELQQKLFDKYPSLFEYRKGTRLPIMFGVETGDGWFKIIDKMCNDIVLLDDEVKLIQVKEKFGLLRVYVSAAIEEVYDIIDNVENESAKVCEFCGSKMFVKQRSPFGWIHTMCLRCHFNYVVRIKMRNLKWKFKLIVKKIMGSNK